MSEKKDAPVRVLFSCFGSSDPARGEHDGGMLHILRHCHPRPDAVMLFLTKQVVERDQKDHRIAKTWELMREKWGYQPELIRYPTDIEDPSNLDVIDQPLRDAMQTLVNLYPNADVLLNLSSGTPQMKLILVQLTLELKNPKGIQVKSYKGAANTAPPTLDKNYNVDEELKLAEEEETKSGTENRCSAPELIPARRAQQRQRVEALLRSKDYQAVAKLLGGQSIVPEEAFCMAKHLAARYALRSKEAEGAVQDLEPGFPLYPKQPEATDAQKQAYAEVSEYFLMMKNFAETGRYTDFVLRLNPLTIRLQEALLDRLLLQHYKLLLQELKGTEGSDKEGKLLKAQLRVNTPHLLEGLNKQLKQEGKNPYTDSYPSIHIYNLILNCFQNLKNEEVSCLELFQSIEKLNSESRNQAAHNLTAALTDADIQKGANCSCAELVQALEKAIITLYPACDSSLFNIYRKCEEYIRERL